MKTFAFVLLTVLIAPGTRAATATPADATAATATATASTPASKKVECIRGNETGSNRTKRVCLPEERFDRLTADERIDLMHSDRTPAELLGD